MPQISIDNDLWCRRYHPTTTAVARLVCLPHAGGSATFYHPVSAMLSPQVDVVAIQYPGRQDRRNEPAINDLAELADLIYGILRRQDDLPVTLFGHSMGALVGFEVARRLEAGGQRPVRLYASGRRAPSTHRDEAVHLRDDAGILAEIRRMDGTASSVLGDEEMMRAALPALRADYQATETYTCPPEVTVGCAITALVGSSDPKTTADEARAWSRHTSGPFDLQVFTGGHFYLTSQADEVIRLLDQHFRQARLPGPSGEAQKHDEGYSARAA